MKPLRIILESKAPPRVSFKEVFASFFGAFIGIGLIGVISMFFFDSRGMPLIIPPFGASAVLLFGAYKSPLSQPRHVIGGHLISAFSGVIAYLLFENTLWLATGFGVALAIALMHLTRTLHPPGGATTLVYILGGAKFHQLGFIYLLFPVGIGILILTFSAIIVNKFLLKRAYPEYWW